MAKRMHFRRLAPASEYECLLAARLQIDGGYAREAFGGLRQLNAWERCTEFAGNRKRDVANQSMIKRQAMVGIGAGQAPAGFNAIKTKKVVRRCGSPRGDEIVTEPYLPRTRSDRIVIQRQHDPRVLKAR